MHHSASLIKKINKNYKILIPWHFTLIVANGNLIFLNDIFEWNFRNNYYIFKFIFPTVNSMLKIDWWYLNWSVLIND
jgi:hypothetical protein